MPTQARVKLCLGVGKGKEFNKLLSRLREIKDLKPEINMKSWKIVTKKYKTSLVSNYIPVNLKI